MIKLFTKQNTFAFLTILALIGNVAISGISNASVISNLIKIVSSSLLLIIFFIHSHISGIDLYSPDTASPLRKMGLLIAAILLYLAITLLYSTNPAYGGLKIFNILISDIPNIIVLFYLIAYREKELFEKYLIYIIAAGFVLTLIAVLVVQPFDQSTSYYYEPGRWSHVFIGRIISFLTLIVFLYVLNEKKSKELIIYSVIFTIGLYITYLTGLRSALIGLGICSIAAIIWSLYNRYLNKFHLYSLISILIVFAALIYVTPQGFSTSQRISNLVKVEDLNFGGDGAISTRLESYKIGWQMFKESPFIGYGFGSFNGYNNIEWTTLQKYPHNIILEILSELGIVGLLIFGVLFLIIIRSMFNVQFTMINEQSEVKSQKSNVKGSNSLGSSLSNEPAASNRLSYASHFLLLAFLFSFFLAMFSKDISTQGFLWLFLVALSGKGKKLSS